MAFGLYRVFDIRKLSIVVFDNADVTATHSLVQQNLIQHLSSQCQKIFISCTKIPSKPIGNIRNLVEKKLLIDGAKYPRHMENYYIRCDENGAKIEALKAICLEAYSSNAGGKVVVYFSVSVMNSYLWCIHRVFCGCHL